MPTDLELINIGLAKLASEIQSINPPRSSLERHCKVVYPHIRDKELAKGRWTFAMFTTDLERTATPMSQVDPLAYEYHLPSNHLRVLRDKTSEWEQRGDTIVSRYDSLRVHYIRRIPEGEFHPLFNEVLACAIALACVKKVETSVTSAEDLRLSYREALRDARLNNAWTIGPEDIDPLDEHFEVITGRYAPHA